MSKVSPSKKLVTAGAGLALLLGLGGATFATWSDTATLAGGTVTAGDLKVSATDDTAWRDASDRRATPKSESYASDLRATPKSESYASQLPGHPITIANFRTVPGDVLLRTQTVTAHLVGDNLTAGLTLGNFTDASGEFFTAKDADGEKYVTVTNQVLNSDNAPVGNDNTVTLVSANYVAAGNTLPEGAIVVDPDGNATFTVATLVEFSPGTPNRVLTQANGALGDATVTLSQVR